MVMSSATLFWSRPARGYRLRGVHRSPLAAGDPASRSASLFSNLAYECGASGY